MDMDDIRKKRSNHIIGVVLREAQHKIKNMGH